jgi:hypothetical protein
LSFMENQFYKAKKDKFDLLFAVKPELNPVVHCAYHPSEGCTECVYIQRCSIKEDGFFIQ